jgi:hypothetical protein
MLTMPAQQNELTLRGVILGVLITLIFTAANVFFGLTKSASSAPAQSWSPLCGRWPGCSNPSTAGDSQRLLPHEAAAPMIRKFSPAPSATFPFASSAW